MYQFTIHLPPERVQALIERDCVQRRHAPGYWGKDYRAVLMMHGLKPLSRVQAPGFMSNYYRYFRYELIGEEMQTSIRGKFVFPIYTQVFPFLQTSVLFGFAWWTGPRIFMNPLALFCLILFTCIIFFAEYLARKHLPQKEYKEEQESGILAYFARLARTYSAEPSDADVAGEEPPAG